MFKIQADFNLNDLNAIVNGVVDGWVEELIERYKAAGIRFVDKARAQTKEEGGFGNVTWNLRSSIGCLIAYNNQILLEYFPPIKGGTDGEKIGSMYAREIALLVNEPDTVFLIVVAGMEYASLVESRTGNPRDVITHIGKQLPKDILKELNS